MVLEDFIKPLLENDKLINIIIEKNMYKDLGLNKISFRKHKLKNILDKF